MQRHEYRLMTPENVDFVYELAGPAARLAAALIDQAMVLLFIVLAWAAAVVLLPLASLLSGAVFAAANITAFLILYGYFAFCEAKFMGQTFGKRLMGIRVMDDRGLPLTPMQALLRNLLRPIDMLPYLPLGAGIESMMSVLQLPPVGFYAVGGVALLLSPGWRRLGDWVGGTVVVRVAERPAPGLILAPSERHNSLLEDTALQRRAADLLSREDRELIWQLCIRRSQLDLATRQRLFAEAARYLCSRLDLVRPEHVSDEKLVQNIAALALRDRTVRGAAGGARSPAAPSAAPGSLPGG